ncbi:MAG: hypothetical protein LBR19_01295 [Bifidobacteriaceae bacterium]|nr:hypothetical protein [Bifidobacteriaceae bacterium]
MGLSGQAAHDGARPRLPGDSELAAALRVGAGRDVGDDHVGAPIARSLIACDH